MTDTLSSLNVASFPTTGAPRLDAPGFTWQQEWYVAASLGDLPRLERARYHGADPTSVDKSGHTAAHWYALSHESTRPAFTLTSVQKGQIWAWLASQGVPMHTLNHEQNSPMMIMTSRNIIGTRLDSDTTASDLWNAFSYEEKQRYLSFLTAGDKMHNRPQIHTLVMAHKSILSLEKEKQVDAQFFLGSLLRIHASSFLENQHTWDTRPERSLFWNAAYGPEWLYDLPKKDAKLCKTLHHSLHTICTVFESVYQKKPNGMAFHKEGWDDLYLMLENRLTTLLRRLLKADFPLQPTTRSLLRQIDAVRPLLDAHALHQTLGEPLSTESTLSALSSRRPRL